MAFTVPTLESSPTFDAQTCVDTTDLNALMMCPSGNGVQSGMAVTPSSLMTIAIASGVAIVNNLPVTYAGGTIAVGAASSFDRRDIVTISSAGTIVVTAGTPGTVAGWTKLSTALPPVKPAIPANAVLLAEVYVASTTTTVATGNIVDKRCTCAATNVHNSDVALTTGLTTSAVSVTTLSLPAGTYLLNTTVNILASPSLGTPVNVATYVSGGPSQRATAFGVFPSSGAGITPVLAVTACDVVTLTSTTTLTLNALCGTGSGLTALSSQGQFFTAIKVL